jgi:hypothetical protein
MSCVAIFMDRYTFRREMKPTCHTSQAKPHHQARRALPGASAPAPYHVLGPKHFLPLCTTWMNEVDQGNVGLIEWMKL